MVFGGFGGMLATISAPQVQTAIKTALSTLGGLGTTLKWAMLAIGAVLLCIMAVQYLWAAMRGRHREHHKKMFVFIIAAILLIDIGSGQALLTGAILQGIADLVVLFINLFTGHISTGVVSHLFLPGHSIAALL